MIQNLARLAAAVAILIGPLLILGAGGAAAEEDEAPYNVIAFANAPGMITIVWEHSGDGVYWFVLEQESPYGFVEMDADKRIWSVPNLQPNRTYSYRVCAVYTYHRVCSDEDGVGWASATTFPPESAGAPPAAPAAPAPGGQSSIPALPTDATSFESVNYSGHFMRHRNSLGELTTVNSDLDRQDSTFVVRQGLSGAPNSVSFESVNYPGRFLRHQDFRLKLHTNDGANLFRQDATFVQRGAVCPGCAPGGMSFESVNAPGHFIRHANYELWIARNDGSDLFAKDATWRPGLKASFESINYPGHFMRHRNSLGELTRVSSDLDRADATFIVRPALNGSSISVSFESVNYPDHFLRHQNYRLKLHQNDGSELFRQDASFMQQGAECPGCPRGEMSFESANLPGHFIRHQNYELWLAKSDGSDLFAKDATWRQVGPR